MIKWILIVVAAFVVLGFLLSKKKSTGRESAGAQMPVTSEPRDVKTGLLDDVVNEVYIAGLAHHCTMADVGPFSGVIFPQKDNPVDRKAMAIGDHRRKKILGYVPSAILDDYRAWCKRDSRPCVGYIYWDGEHLRGRCRVYPTNKEADNKKYAEDASAFIAAVAKHFEWALNEDGTIKQK